ncbi:cell cycle protein, FtsW/RodA/SpoVE family [Candidatus Arthromitus sp. SFB-mouse-Japan]|uniref:FtsW/RodA/SpoVE family cell cycle protein n=2 Tax=unclassified Candidatus Neoarthromitus TaxID=2638829 RepID=UPI00021B8043|nr:FtsW/RodA/SpoVE family cell cycle protein [Candidatus Arthromitus sp. SFB-mouse]EIA22684.1 Cell cycle protein, FtsW/RodA/SpoVE family [Candidatus Arthromitus sp. SFB-3]EIA24244.1 Cell cycle protein, FtsW/RodA/SpoVE family [Candidatus Arthromitus sp. SFB-1]EIA24331.1 Cell cycle protein, FtsW/RodA/SpoVE family [Candidatus Arthromitus sp. SFB-2]EIA26090.1 Cell cycle protein, FtsW/RodA/SpoVE family [Candidatus Arthromitus sp. SFB-4]EIA29277.1 Cell cycle protein, FtsW/RodA/SpoVE family [Candidat
MVENVNEKKLYFVLNLILSIIVFLNLLVGKRSIDFYLCFISISYILIISIVSLLQFLVFKVDSSLNLIVNLFVLLGLTIIYRINPAMAFKQCILFLFGYIFYLLIMFFGRNIHEFVRFKWIYFFLSLVLMSLSFLFGEYINGSKNWISFFGITFQPSEFGKIFVILYLSSILRNNRDKIDKYMAIFLILFSLIFLILQKDLGTAIIIIFLSMLMYYIRTSKYKFLLIIIIATLILGVLAYINFPHVRVRIHAWLNPESDPNFTTYQVLQGFFAMGSGGFLGRGLYRGNLELIPVNYTDYIFVSIVEELGIFTGILITLLYFLFFIKVMKNSMKMKAKDESKLLMVGFNIIIALQTTIILGGVLNLIPLTGITLPFISYGGSSIISMFIMFGIMQKLLEGDFL